MVLWIGVDDTDSLGGMCTTFLATELVRALGERFDLIGYPRLVRLNPNVPWKTRGNGAICLRIGRGVGEPAVVGRIAGHEVLSFRRSAANPPEEEVVKRVASLVERWSCFDDPTTHPAFVVLRKRPDSRLYWRAVREFVEVEEALEAVRDRGVVRMYKEGRGIIGAAAAAAWRPRDRTYEVLTYRQRPRWGSPRDIDASTVRAMDQRFSTTFNNYDYGGERVVIAPRSPCPILFGIRGDDASELPAAMQSVRSERMDRWLLFETNQGTDDHVRPRGRPIPGTALRFRGRVTSLPKTLPGGHVLFAVREIPVMAYEPSKRFRDIVRLLRPGDVVDVVGSVRFSPRTINLEKIRVMSVAPYRIKVANPLCPTCGRRAKSLGRRAGFGCPAGHSRMPHTAAIYATVARSLLPGWYEPPVGSRRHLSKPLRRLVLGASLDSHGGGGLDSHTRDTKPPFEPFHDFGEGDGHH